MVNEKKEELTKILNLFTKYFLEANEGNRNILATKIVNTIIESKKKKTKLLLEPFLSNEMLDTMSEGGTKCYYWEQENEYFFVICVSDMFDKIVAIYKSYDKINWVKTEDAEMGFLGSKSNTPIKRLSNLEIFYLNFYNDVENKTQLFIEYAPISKIKNLMRIFEERDGFIDCYDYIVNTFINKKIFNQLDISAIKLTIEGKVYYCIKNNFLNEKNWKIFVEDGR